MTLDQFILENGKDHDWAKLANVVNAEYGTRYNRHSIRSKHSRLEVQMGKKEKPPVAEETLEERRQTKKSAISEKVARKLLDEATERLEKLEREKEVILGIQEYQPFEIVPKLASGKSESTVVVLASDWHVEEHVDLGAVNGLNEYNLAVAKERSIQFFQGALRLTEIFQKDTNINTMVLALLGDFISGSIHEDIAENTEVGPTKAVIYAQELIISGIEFLLANSKLNLVIPCHSGNHGRATKEQRMATENENSFEFLMYHMVAKHFEGNKRVKVLISEGYVSYLPVYDKTIRFHHGHGMKYGGGVGGLFVPVYKAIARWNDGRRADLDCFGHFHQFRDGGSFICNGSMIGYNAYAVSKGISYEKPQQVMFVVEKKRGRTFTVPITFK